MVDDGDNRDDCRWCNDEDNDDDGQWRYDDDDDSRQCEDDNDYNNGRWRYDDNEDGLRWEDVGGVMTWLTITNLHFTINLETKWLHSKHVSHPQNHRQATTNIAMKLLPPSEVEPKMLFMGHEISSFHAQVVS